MRVILLILIGFSSFVDAGGFSRNNGVVSDSTSNLEWQDDYTDNDFIKETTWESAISYCEGLTLDGKSDWSLPNLNELTSLVDDSNYNPSLNDIFQNSNASNYWSSTGVSLNNEAAWMVNFYSGFQDYNFSKNNNSYVRCVRAGQ